MRKEDFLVMVAAVLLTLIVLSPVAYMAYSSMPPQVAQVDLQKLVEEEQQRTIDVLSKSGGAAVTDEQRAAIEKLTIAFAKQLWANVDTLGSECKCVIVNKAAVLGGSVIDYTDTIRQRMKR